VRRILAQHASDASSDPDFYHLLVEDYLPGREVALEGTVTRGELRVLALFDKPDDLVGPYFEETLYVTPSRLSAPSQAAIIDVAARAARAIGLTHGPVHAELRVDGPRVAMVEIAARSIGGLCSRAFEQVTGSLEDIVLSHAAGLSAPHREASGVAAGVMMMPIPRNGVLRKVTGIEAARPGIEEVTASPRSSIRTLGRSKVTSGSSSRAARRRPTSSERSGLRSPSSGSKCHRCASFCPRGWCDVTCPSWAALGSAQQNHGSVSLGTNARTGVATSSGNPRPAAW
jgi:hypothetical protein